MSETFNYWNNFFEAMGRPLQSEEPGSPLGILVGATKPAEEYQLPQAPLLCAQEHRGDTITALDAVAGRVLAANRVIQRYGICPQGSDCLRVNPQTRHSIWKCDHCDFVGCGLCHEVHEMEPHMTDAMNVASGKG